MEVVGKKASFIYLETIMGMSVGYFLWLFLSRLTTPDVIGISSTIISLATIFSVIVDLGVSRGSTLFLGKNFSEGRLEDAAIVVKSSLLLVFLAISICSLSIFVFRESVFPEIPIDLILVSILLMGSSAIYNLMRAFLIASLQTQRLPIVMLIGSVCKIILTIILILLGTGALGITIGYLSFYFLAAVLLFLTLTTMLTRVKPRSFTDCYNTCKSILHASVATWLPRVLAAIGTRLGTVVVFGFEGASQAAYYFIAFSIYSVIVAIADSLISASFPILSAMEDHRKRFVWRMMKVSLVITLPLCSAGILYSNEILGLFGSDYIQGSISLKIMLLSMLALIFSSSISTLVYTYGNYWQVLAIGLGSSMSRISCYFILVPYYGSTGAAISFAMGSIIGFAVSVLVARKIRMLIFWKELAIIFIIPTSLSFALGQFHVDYVIGIPIMLALPLTVFFVFRVLTKSDMLDSLKLLPNRIGRPLINVLNKL